MPGKIIRNIALIVLLLTGSCIDPIDFDVTRVGFQLVVYGHIDNGAGPFFIELSRTSDLPFRYTPETGARITLHDDLGNEGRFYNGNAQGLYEYNEASMPIVAGRSYVLRIRTAAQQVYESSPQIIPVQRATSDVNLTFEEVEENTGSAATVVTKRYMTVTTNTDLEDPSADYYIRYNPVQTFRFDGTDFPDPFNSLPPPCFVNRRIQPEYLPLFSSAGFTGSRLENYYLGRSEFDYAWITKNIVSVETHTIGREAYEYWRKVRILLNNTGSVFDTPPAAIKGNMFNVEDPEEEVLGFFEVSGIHIARTTTWFLETPWGRPEDECLYDPEKPLYEYFNRCLNCESIEGAQRPKPIFY